MTAIADYEVIRLKPNDAGAYNLRGLAYDGKGDYDRAIADYNEAIRLKRDYAVAYNNRCLAYERKATMSAPSRIAAKPFASSLT